MARLLGFFFAVLALMWLLRHVPGLGWLGHSLIGFWVAALAVSGLSAWTGSRLLTRRRLRSRVEALGATDTPHNQGKLGSLLLAAGRPRQALPHLERALAGEGESVEWRYRLALAQLACGEATRARELLAEVARRAPEHAYGAVHLKLAEAQLAAGDAAGSRATVQAYERDHGESPESAYRLARAARALGERAEAGAHFARARKLASRAPAFQRREARAWALRSLVAQLF